jgi:hypothetical protein
MYVPTVDKSSLRINETTQSTKILDVPTSQFILVSVKSRRQYKIDVRQAKR